MMVKAIVRGKIIIPGRAPTDEDLKRLNCYYESFSFKINPEMEYEEKYKYAIKMDETYAKHMYDYSIEFVEV